MSKKPLPTLPRTERTLESKWGRVTFRAWGLGDQSLILQAISPAGDTPEEERAQALEQLLRTNIVSIDSKEFKDIADAPIFLAELILMRMRALALGEKATVSRLCDGCPPEEKPQRLDFEFNIDKDIIIEEDDSHKAFIEIGEYRLNLRYPTIASSTSLANVVDAADASVVLTSKFISSVTTEEEYWDFTEYDDEEIREFISRIGSDVQTEIIRKFVSTMPYTKLHLEKTCPKCGKHHSFDVKGVSRLFTV